MTESRFSEEDLAPSNEERQAVFRERVDRIAATVAVVATGVWVGGMLALGACAAPFVFRMTPAPYSGDAMGAAFARFDQVAIGAAVALLGAEVTRTWSAGLRGSRTVPARIRRMLAVLMAGSAALVGLSLTPAIMALHKAGAQRGVGAQGDELERIHKRAEAIGKAQTVAGVALIGLHIFTIGARRREDEDDAFAAPAPPGPR